MTTVDGVALGSNPLNETWCPKLKPMLVPGDCLVPLNRWGSKGLLLIIGVTETGCHMALLTPGRSAFTFERWSNIVASWDRGETRKLSTFQ